MVERLHIERPAWPDDEGELVRYSDYATLQQRVDELTRELARVRSIAGESRIKLYDDWSAAEARVSELEAEVREAKEALDGACAQILDSYRTWVADNCDAHPRPGQIPRYDRARTTLTRLTTISDRKAEGGEHGA